MECPYWVDNKVAGSCMPRPGDLEKWISLGIKTVYTLAEAWEMEYYGGWGLLHWQRELSQRGMKWIHWPTPDGYPPRRLDQLVAEIAREAQNGAVVVHCVAGVGRTPTALAAYLVYAKCLDAEEALRRVEEVNPHMAISQEQYYAVLEIEAIARETCKR